MNRRRFLSICIIIFMLIIGCSAVFAAPNEIVEIIPDMAKISIDGKIENMNTLMFKDKVYVSIRDISEHYGLKVYWDSKKSIVEIDSSISMGKKFLYIISKALQLSGLALLIQVAFFRSKKDYYFVKKFSTSQTSLRRLAHTAGASRMGVYFCGIGTLISFFIKESGISLFIQVPIILVLTGIMWFLGLGAANSTTKQQRHATGETYET